MRKLRLILVGVVIGLLAGAVGVKAATPLSDADLLGQIKQSFVAAGWTPPTTGTTTPPTQTATKPSDITGQLWTVTGPFNKPSQTNDPQNEYVSVAQTDSSFNPYMYMNGGAIVLKTPVNGVTTSNSSYPRTEFREMKDTNWKDASWTNKTGTSTLTVREAIVNEPVVKPEVVSAQIHDSSDDVMQIFLQGNKLYTRYNDDNSLSLIDGNYILGTPFDLKIVAANKQILVYYNGTLKTTISQSGSGWYFKAGSYCQSNVAHGDSASAYCEVDIYSLGVTHV